MRLLATRVLAAAAVLTLVGPAALAQPVAPPAPPAAAPAPPVVISPEVHADRRVTFRFRAPNAKEVAVARAGAARLPMTRDEQGTWSVTTEPLPPDIYQYTFNVDGTSTIDPMNGWVAPNLLNMSNMVRVPGTTAEALPWEITDVPRGELRRHFYKSARIGDHRDYYVYTPPGYDPRRQERYPVLYLLHGFSDDASGWTSVGQAHVILDNLIAARKVEPMLVVMTLGYGAPEIVTRGARAPQLRQKNMEGYRDALFAEVIPAIEKAYHADSRRERRAIAGLSMGGAESLFVGLNAIDRFAWVGAFSAGGLGEPGTFAQVFPSLDAADAKRLKLLWIACGTEDGLIDANRQVRAFLTERGVSHEAIETPGAHTWLVWRRNLAEFTPKLFR
jgi:enterochelin esterase family protein